MEREEKDGLSEFGPYAVAPRAVYELRQVYNVVFFGEAPKEIAQLEEGVLERVVQRAAPLLKRKPGH
ncbi:hypothetical protein PC129_g9761 [Phytophthora cactorum]|uniref:Uncharacterized protein n=1 Tax=Phytophthora cactorum TaxID=29920 RepID=A0A329SQQ7_9STRA|nr:hypothetical protein Pcac1_g14853 [Phytophthora cactorum]KAG2807506.1 hypothetical protein PC112_g17367 [Phytophthora cactorum]KAG2835373.1 hypothetical protein PC111_g5465 [Phytophthora cactorum]KAG2859788.1 hypothetical protein PC113_g8617 [Phytophthora cactorum]KAG2893708.1 hypothetical protein PC117_g23710 [Phytophthora cactorum]